MVVKSIMLLQVEEPGQPAINKKDSVSSKHAMVLMLSNSEAGISIPITRDSSDIFTQQYLIIVSSLYPKFSNYQRQFRHIHTPVLIIIYSYSGILSDETDHNSV